MMDILIAIALIVGGVGTAITIGVGKAIALRDRKHAERNHYDA